MKKLITLLLALLIAAPMFASSLFLIPTTNFDETKELFSNPSVKIHFYREDFVIATSTEKLPGAMLLDETPRFSDLSYYMVYTGVSVNRKEYMQSIDYRADILHQGEYFLIIRSDEKTYGQLPPAQNDGMVRLSDTQAKLPPTEKSFAHLVPTSPDPAVVDLLTQVDGDLISGIVQHLESYGTRDSYVLESVFAQNWIEEQFLSWGLEVETMSFTMPGGDASDNVIATLPGTLYPYEHVVLGGHYDSFSFSGLAPGADDNASGTAGVMEIARILSNYEFERTIIFCAFSGEEYGLYGSKAYAQRSAGEGKIIHGYFNMDMIGYLKPGNTTIMTSLIYPPSAQPLADFYTDVTALYLPDFVVQPANFTQGDSDHTSFNNNGYMGIFPFEDVNNYSPYIHTSNDITGPSYNNQEQAVIFTQAVLASVVTMAGIPIPAGISERNVQSFIYPNPARENVTVYLPAYQPVTVTLTGLTGQVLLRETLAGTSRIETSGMKSGLYLLSVEGENYREVHKLVIE